MTDYSAMQLPTTQQPTSAEVASPKGNGHVHTMYLGSATAEGIIFDLYASGGRIGAQPRIPSPKYESAFVLEGISIHRGPRENTIAAAKRTYGVLKDQLNLDVPLEVLVELLRVQEQ